MKRLKLRIVKFDRLLLIEQLEIEGEFERTEHTSVCAEMFLGNDYIDLQESCKFGSFCLHEFPNNQERDECAANLVKWITEEQFGLEIGKPCLVSNDGKNWHTLSCFAGTVALKLGVDKRFLVKIENEDDKFFRCRFAKPLNYAQPKIDGEFYTWEIGE